MNGPMDQMNGPVNGPTDQTVGVSGPYPRLRMTRTRTAPSGSKTVDSPATPSTQRRQIVLTRTKNVFRVNAYEKLKAYLTEDIHVRTLFSQCSTIRVHACFFLNRVKRVDTKRKM